MAKVEKKNKYVEIRAAADAASGPPLLGELRKQTCAGGLAKISDDCLVTRIRVMTPKGSTIEYKWPESAKAYKQS